MDDQNCLLGDCWYKCRSCRSARPSTAPANGCAPKSSIGRQLNKILALESIIGDVPQIVLTALVTYDQGELSFYGAFNFATSVYNIVLNSLESCGNVAEVDDEEEEEEEEYEDQVIIDEA